MALMFKNWLNPKVEDICPNCGQACVTTDVLCPNCGKNLDELFEQLPDSVTPSQQQTFRLSIWWKILIALNIIVDVPFLLHAFTGYEWNCRYKGLPDIVSTSLAGLLSLILVWAIIKSTLNNRGFLDVVTTGLFVILFSIVACWASLAFILAHAEGPSLQASIPSPSAQRIAELCSVSCESCPTPYALRVGYHLMPFVDLYITDLKYEYPSYFVPQIEWIDDSTISVREAGNTTRMFQPAFMQPEWQFVMSFLIYVGIKYGLVLLRLHRQN